MAIMTSLNNLDPRAERELGAAALRRIEILRILTEHAEAGTFEAPAGMDAMRKDDLIRLADGLMAQGKIPPLTAPPQVSNTDKRVSELEAQVKALLALNQPKADEPEGPSMAELRSEAKAKGINTFGMKKADIEAAIKASEE